MDNIKINLQETLKDLPRNVRLVAVSKYHPIEDIQKAYDCGQRIFGESKAQEVSLKHEVLPKDIEWHFIGHLQTNKVKYIAPYVALIHGIDSYKLLCEVNRQGARFGRVIPCLLQIHVAQEETKFGFSLEECRSMLDMGEWKQLTNICICGIMGMASNTDDSVQIKKEFYILHTFFHEIKQIYFAKENTFAELSMGMSDDYKLAIEEGSTLIRVGSKIFGERM